MAIQPLLLTVHVDPMSFQIFHSYHFSKTCQRQKWREMVHVLVGGGGLAEYNLPKYPDTNYSLW